MPGEGSEYTISMVYNGQGMEKSVGRLGTVAGRATEKLKGMVAQKGYLYYSMKRIVAYTAIFSFFAALAKSIGEVVQLELRLAEVNTLIDKTNQDAVNSYNDVTAALIKLDPHLGTAIDLTRGLYEIISAGVTDPQQAFELLVTSAKYAKVGLTDLKTASASLTAVMKAYGFTAEAMRGKSDVLFASVREGKFHTDELNASIGKILPTAATMNVSIEEVAAALAVMTQRGLDVNEASTSLNRMLISFLRPIDKAKARFQALGWEYGRNAFQSITLTGALKRLETATKRYGDLLPIVFRRQRALKGGFILQGQGLKDLESMYHRVSGATAGSGIIQQEFGRITGTVSMELEALHANVQQGVAALLKYKGGVAAAVRDLSMFLRTVIELAPKLMALMGAFVFNLKIMKLLKNEYLLTTVATHLHTKAVAGGMAAEEAATMVKTKMTAATTAAKHALVAFNVILLVATVAYTAITWWINKKKKAEKEAAEAAERHAKAMEKVVEQINIMNVAFEKAKGFQYDFSQAVENSAVYAEYEQVIKQIQKVGEETGNLERAFKDFKKSSKLDLGVHKEAWEAIESLLSLKGYDPDAMKKAWNLFRDMSIESGNMERAAADLSNREREASESYAKSLDAVSQKLRAFARDVRLAIQEMETDKAQLALNYTEEALLDMAQALRDVQKELDPLQKAQLKNMGIDVEALLKDPAKLLQAIQTYMEAAEEALGAKAAARVQDYMRSVRASMEDVTFTLEKATEKATAYFLELGDMRTFDRDDLVVWASKNVTEIEKVLSWGEKLPEEARKFLEQIMQWREEDKKSLVDWAKKYKDAYDKVADDQIKILSKIQTLQNEYNQNQHENILESYKRERISFINHINDKFDLAVEAGENLLVAAVAREVELGKIQEWGQEAKKVSQYRALQEELKRQKSNLDALKLSARERARVSMEMAEKSHEWLKGLGIEDEKFMALLAKIIKEYWEDIQGDAEAGINWLKEYEQFFRAVGTSISTTAEELTKFLDMLGLGGTFASRFASALYDVGQGMSDFAKHLKAIKEAKELGGLAGAIGQIGGTIGAVVTIATTAISVFKKLFGGKTDKEKAQEEADRKARELEEMMAQMQQAYSYLGTMSDNMAKKLAELRQGGMEGWLAEATLLNEIMADIGINAQNFNEWASKTIDIMYNVRDGFIDASEGAKIIGDAFTQLKDAAIEMGTEGSRAMLELIWAAQEMNQVVPEIAEYIAEKLNLAAAGLAAAISWIAKDAVEASTEIQKLTKEKRKLLREIERINKRMGDYDVGSDKYKEAVKRLAELGVEVENFNKQIRKQQEIIGAHGKETKRHIENLSVITAATFNAMIQSGRPLLEVMNEMKDSVFALMERYKALGLEVPNYLKPIFKVFKQFRKTPEFFAGLQGLTDTMKGLGDSGFLTAEAFKALNREAKAYYTQMITTKDEGGFGFTDEQAIRMMYPMLQQMWWYAEQYGMKLPKWAKEAMKEAEKLGLKFEKPAVEKQIELMEDVYALQKKRFARMVDLLADIKNRVGGSYQHGSPSVPGGFAHLHPGESVLPENVTTALKQFFLGRAGSMEGDGGGGVAVVPVYIDGQLVYRAMVPYIKKGGVYNDFEVGGDGVY